MWFFFATQKTAYEMRISDWSSDGCASDLKHLYAGRKTGGVADPRVDLRRLRFHDHAGAAALGPPHLLAVERSDGRAGLELGRASCRGRACQTVQIPAGYVIIKNNKRQILTSSVDKITIEDNIITTP